ncbi:peptidoglycan-N-acetylglucosamine deacetylase [Entomortierella parvispora]|uniref:Peptidoglycan-N-acetylglucosamine deacetylase n=1 Tax=Entomortierella parvispora TaxID=205924 RepID=A0A9P3LZT6_9FUNG|nr:peptidoglycan-N-acetylglucosamine deacetylase [Entomortierella parvispora]
MRPSFLSVTLVMAVVTMVPSTFAEMSKKQQKQYPPKDELPDVNSAIVKKWVAEIDWSKVPKLPLAKAKYPDCPDCPSSKKLIPKDACWWTCDGCVAKDDIEVCPRAKAWGLTYDDGPSEETPRLLKKLKQANVTSTFFVVGSRVLEYPETLLQEVKDGHHIGLHTWSHAGMTSLTNEQIVAEVKWAEKIVFDVTGLRTKYWRPPYGDVDNRVREILRQLGYVTVIWTKEWDSNDWQIPDKTITNKEVFRNFKWALSTVPKLKGGVITLEHDLFTQTVNVAGPLLDMGMKKGLEPMDIAQCVNDPNPYQNSLDKKPAAKAPAAKAPVVGVKNVGTEQTPLVKPKEVTPVVDENIPSEGSEEGVVTEAKAKAASANKLALTATSVVLVAVSAFFSL